MKPEPGARAEVLAALLGERHSRRGFKPEPVPRVTIDAFLAVAQRTASWCNVQPWQVHVFSTAATERVPEELLDYSQSHPPQPDFDWPGAYGGRRRECGRQTYQATGVARGDREAGARQRRENFRSAILGPARATLRTQGARPVFLRPRSRRRGCRLSCVSGAALVLPAPPSDDLRNTEATRFSRISNLHESPLAAGVDQSARL